MLRVQSWLVGNWELMLTVRRAAHFCRSPFVASVPDKQLLGELPGVLFREERPSLASCLPIWNGVCPLDDHTFESICYFLPPELQRCRVMLAHPCREAPILFVDELEYSACNRCLCLCFGCLEDDCLKTFMLRDHSVVSVSQFVFSELV